MRLWLGERKGGVACHRMVDTVPRHCRLPIRFLLFLFELDGTFVFGVRCALERLPIYIE